MIRLFLAFPKRQPPSEALSVSQTCLIFGPFHICGPTVWGPASHPVITTNTSTPQYPLLRQERTSVMEEEPANDYCINGGYLRVNVGDKLGPEGRYIVKRKLG